MNTNIRASSLSELFDCPARWKAKYLDGLCLPSSGAAQLGTAIHASTAAYDESRLNGECGISVDDAIGPLVDALYRPETDVDWEDSAPREAEKIGRALHEKYCREIAPKKEYIGVEVTCERLVLDDVGLTLTGTTDRIYRDDQGRAGIADIKTGRAVVSTEGAVRTAGHAYQLGVYALLAEQSLGIDMEAPGLIIGMQTAKTKDGQRIAVGEMSGTREVLLGDEDHPGVLSMAGALIKSGSFHGNPRSMLCAAKYCPAYAGCKLR